MRKFFPGLLLTGCLATPSPPPAVMQPDLLRPVFEKLNDIAYQRREVDPKEQFLQDWIPCEMDIRRFLWSGQPLQWSHGRRLTPQVRTAIWKLLDRYPDYIREFFPVLPDEYLERARHDADFNSRYEADWNESVKTVPLVLQDLKGDARFLRGQLHGSELQTYLAGITVQQLKVVVSQAFLLLNSQEREWCVRSLSLPKEFPGTSSCGTGDAYMAPYRRALARQYAVWSPRCLRFLSAPHHDKPLLTKYFQLRANDNDFDLDISSKLLANTFVAVNWPGKAAWESRLQRQPDEDVLLLRFDPAQAPSQLAYISQALRGKLVARTRRTYLGYVQELVRQIDYEPALAVLLEHADDSVHYFRPRDVRFSPALLSQARSALHLSSNPRAVALALHILAQASDTAALPDIRALEASERGRRMAIDYPRFREHLGDFEPKQKARSIYNQPASSGHWVRDNAHVFNPLAAELCVLWANKPKEHVSEWLLCSPCQASDRWLLARLGGTPNASMVAEAIRRRRYLRPHKDLLAPLLSRSGSARGLASLIVGNLPDLHGRLSGSDDNAAFAILSGARAARLPLPLEPLPALAARSKAMRRAVQSYLVSVEGPEVTRMLRANFGEGNLPGLLGSRAFQIQAAPALARLKSWGPQSEGMALVTAGGSLFLRQDSAGKCTRSRANGPEQICRPEAFHSISSLLMSEDVVLQTRQDGPGQREILLIWWQHGAVRRAYVSDPSPSNPQGKLVLQILSLWEKA